MLTKDEPENLIEGCYDALVPPERISDRVDRGSAICGAIGLLVLMLMLLIATGTVPLYEWPA